MTFVNRPPLNTDHLARTLSTLSQALVALAGVNEQDDGVMFDLFRNAAIKSFELSLETAGKLLRRSLKSFAASPREVEALTFNEVLRHAGKRGLLGADEVTRWLAYRSNRNTTAHDYGVGFVQQTLALLPAYVQDAQALCRRLAAQVQAED